MKVLINKLDLVRLDVYKEVYTFCMIKPDAVKNNHLGNIIQYIVDHGFEIVFMKKKFLSTQNAIDFYSEHLEKPYFPNLINFITSGYTYGLILRKTSTSGCIMDFRRCMGPSDYFLIRDKYINTIRGVFGTGQTENAVHGSDGVEAFIKESSLYFGT